MATAAIAGWKARLYVSASSASGGTTGMGALFGELREFTLNVAMGAMDATSKDSAGWKENLPGLREWSGAGSGLYLLESTDTGQFYGWETLRQGNTIGMIFYPLSSVAGTGTTGAQKYYGTAIVTGYDIDAPLEGPAGIKVSVKGTGAITRAAATS